MVWPVIFVFSKIIVHVYEFSTYVIFKKNWVMSDDHKLNNNDRFPCSNIFQQALQYTIIDITLRPGYF